MKRKDPEKIALALLIAACLVPPWTTPYGRGVYWVIIFDNNRPEAWTINIGVLIAEFIAIGAIYFLLRRMIDDKHE